VTGCFIGYLLENMMSPAKCIGCNYSGKSNNPEYYQCGYCYYTAKARGTKRRAAALEARAKKLEIEAEIAQDKAAKFKLRHPECGEPKI
jgi:hypothetical protein